MNPNIPNNVPCQICYERKATGQANGHPFTLETIDELFNVHPYLCDECFDLVERATRSGEEKLTLKRVK